MVIMHTWPQVCVAGMHGHHFRLVIRFQEAYLLDVPEGRKER